MVIAATPTFRTEAFIDGAFRPALSRRQSRPKTRPPASRWPRSPSFQTQADAPSCAECGSIMVRNGSCHKCLNCGSTSGCS